MTKAQRLQNRERLIDDIVAALRGAAIEAGTGRKGGNSPASLWRIVNRSFDHSDLSHVRTTSAHR